jgi:hypothetical protein
LSVRGSITYGVAFALFVAIALPLDRSTSAIEQSVLGLTAWGFLVVALWLQAPAVRLQVVVLVVLATLLEVIGSIVWGAYRYRLENLPLYVPAGHGLFYLAALRVASLPALERHARNVVIAITAGATIWMLYGLARPPLPDLLGFVTWAIFIRFIVRGRYPLLYAVSFAMTSALELYGTGLGIWRWAPVLPGLMLPAGNPPTGIGAGYAAMDALTRRIIGRLAPAWDARRAAGRADGAALPSSSTREPEAATAD